MKLKSIIILTCFGFLGWNSQAQSSDSTKRAKAFKNVIKFSVTSTLLFDNIPLIEYERVVSRNQTFSVQVGAVSLPLSAGKISNALQITSTVKRGGYTGAFDYRFYLKKENKDPAPHGVYIGPYVSYYHFHGENDMIILDSTGAAIPALFKSKASVVNIGFQIGYQFLIGRRWTIDCIMFGPSVANYHVNMKLTSDADLSKIKIDEKYQELAQQLANRFPGIGKLVNDQVLEFKGTTDIWSGGFRYSIHVGFRF